MPPRMGAWQPGRLLHGLGYRRGRRRKVPHMGTRRKRRDVGWRHASFRGIRAGNKGRELRGPAASRAYRLVGQTGTLWIRPGRRLSAVVEARPDEASGEPRPRVAEAPPAFAGGAAGGGVWVVGTDEAVLRVHYVDAAGGPGADRSEEGR